MKTRVGFLSRTSCVRPRPRLAAAAAHPEQESAGPAEPGPQARRVALVIGPEGGFSDGEIARLKAAGAATVTLGKTILRTETAGMAALAMIMYELEL